MFSVSHGKWLVLRLNFLLFFQIVIAADSNNPRPNIGFNSYDINAPSSTFSICPKGITRVNGKRICSGTVIFQEYFQNGIDSNIWSHDVHIADSPDYEFVIYDNGEETKFNPQTSTITIKPSIQSNEFVLSTVDLGSKCTSNVPSLCRKTGKGWNILPPIISSRITTKNSFSFQYGIVEIQAKLPKGDWILPQLWLVPKNNKYGSQHYASGQIRIAQSRGNSNLNYQDKDIGCKYLEGGIILGVKDDRHIAKIMNNKDSNKCWGDDMHLFELTWTPEKLQFKVDNQEITTIQPPNGGWRHISEFRNVDAPNPWEGASPMAPFDQEFYIALGVSVGGLQDFPENLPWNINKLKSLLDFNLMRESWERTWNSNSQLEVKKIRVWSL